jgi:hypothetical protein
MRAATALLRTALRECRPFVHSTPDPKDLLKAAAGRPAAGNRSTAKPRAGLGESVQLMKARLMKAPTTFANTPSTTACGTFTRLSAWLLSLVVRISEALNPAAEIVKPMHKSGHDVEDAVVRP